MLNMYSKNKKRWAKAHENLIIHQLYLQFLLFTYLVAGKKLTKT